LIVDQRQFLFKVAPTAVTAAAVSVRPHLASGTGVPREETGALDFIARQMELPYGHGSHWYLRRPFADYAPETLGHQLPYAPRELYRNVIREVNAGCSKTSETLQRLDLSRI
jgi:gluconate 2-dehydrogenase gamma chain